MATQIAKGQRCKNFELVSGRKRKRERERERERERKRKRERQIGR